MFTYWTLCVSVKYIHWGPKVRDSKSKFNNLRTGVFKCLRVFELIWSYTRGKNQILRRSDFCLNYHAVNICVVIMYMTSVTLSFQAFITFLCLYGMVWCEQNYGKRLKVNACWDAEILNYIVGFSAVILGLFTWFVRRMCISSVDQLNKPLNPHRALQIVTTAPSLTRLSTFLKLPEVTHNLILRH